MKKKKEKTRLIQCSAKIEHGAGHRKTSCEYKAVVFPVTSKNNLSRNRFCRKHWKSHRKYYDRWIERPEGVEYGNMAKIERRIKLDAEDVEIKCKDDWVPKYSVDSTEFENTDYVTTYEVDKSLMDRIREKVRLIKRILKDILGG